MRQALVIGAGAAGLFSSWLLAKRGWNVILVGKGTPSAAMSTGCLRREPERCVREVMEFLGDGDLKWATGSRTGISKIGTPFECWMSPSHSTWGDGERPESMTVVGLDGHPSLHPRMASALLRSKGIRAEPLLLPIELPSDVPPTAAFRGDEAWDALAEMLNDLSSEAVLLPAITHLRDHHRLDALERRCGRRVLEAITPLGAPGQRLAALMRVRADEAGVTIWDGRKVASLELQGNAVREATVIGGSDVRKVRTDSVIIASGGPMVDGLLLAGRELADPFGTFQIVRSDDTLRGGYAVIGGMLISKDGRRMGNATAAGDCLFSGDREHGSGLSMAMESAHQAVRALEEA